MKTKGALLRGPRQPWTVEEIEVGDPREGEVKIQLEAVGMCHSDYHLVTGATPMEFPILAGHEGAGIVIEVGAGVTDVTPGDHVVLSFIPSCGRCPSCLVGKSYLCDLGMHLLGGAALSDGTYRVQFRGQDVHTMVLLGAFSPYMVVHQSSVVKIDPDVPLELACLVACCVPTGYGSVVHRAKVEPGEDVGIIGIGGVGMAAVQGAVNSGARYVVAIDPVDWKRDLAMKFGATHTFGSMDEALAAVPDLTEGRMLQKTIIAVGDIKGEHIDPAVNLTAKGGRCVVTAMGDMMNMDVKLNLVTFALLAKDLQGTIFGNANAKFEIPRLLSMYKAGKLNLVDMVTRQYTLEQINEGFQDMLEGKIIRGVIRYTDEDRR
jgi:S-(hydroxymethyl)glutathione dehydrogenase / alcohol dehydrogenase